MFPLQIPRAFYIKWQLIGIIAIVFILAPFVFRGDHVKIFSEKLPSLNTIQNYWRLQPTISTINSWNLTYGLEQTAKNTAADNLPIEEEPAEADVGKVDTNEEYLAICLSVKDQVEDLPEWFTHHYVHIGIRRFYIMDDGSDPPLSTLKKDWRIPRSAITFHWQDPQARVEHQQKVFYDQCNAWYGSSHTWIAYIDADEFFEETSNQTLVEILKELEPDVKVGALAINWKLHTSNSLLHRPESARKGFTTCIAQGHDFHIKSIVKTAAFNENDNPHRFVLLDGALTVGEHGDVVTSEAWRNPDTTDRLALHHYAVKSREEFEAKMLRGNGMSSPKGESFWNIVEHERPHVPCHEMAHYDP